MNMTPMPASASPPLSLPFITATSAAAVVMLVASSDDETTQPGANMCLALMVFFITYSELLDLPHAGVAHSF
jgi:hypothetical protein